MWQSQYRQNLQSGQVLLVLVLLIALVITVLSSISYRLTTEIQSTKSQEENVRVLAAADSGIEKGINIHPLLILLSVLGGIAFFGVIGFILGPIVLSFLFTLFAIYKPIILKETHGHLK